METTKITRYPILFKNIGLAIAVTTIYINIRIFLQENYDFEIVNYNFISYGLSTYFAYKIVSEFVINKQN